MIIFDKSDDLFRLKAIDIYDIEDLRLWKNANKKYFFLKTDIKPDQQVHWFEHFYTPDDDNHMFVVQEYTQSGFVNVGCMGFRKKEYGLDVYNIMRGVKLKSNYKMSTAFMMMNQYIADNYSGDICCKVLPENPARKWYESLGFEEQYKEEEFVFYRLNKSKLPQFDLEVK